MTRVGGQPRSGDLLPTQAFARAVAQIRNERGWTQRELAQRLKERGYGKLSAVAIARLETGKRGASIDDVFALALALDVAPLHLVVPLDDERDADGHVATRVIITGELQPVEPEYMRAWIRGEQDLMSQDPMPFYGIRPASEIEAEREEIDAVTFRGQSSIRAFYTRMWLISKGKAKPLVEKEGSDGS